MNQTHKKRTGAILFALLLATGIWFATRPANPPPEAQPPAQAAAPAAQPAAPAAQPPAPAPTAAEPAAPDGITKTIQAARPREPSSAPRAKKGDTADTAAPSEKTSEETEAKPSEPEAVAEMAPTAEPATTAPPTAAPAPKPPPPPVTAPFVAHFRNRASSNLRIVRVTCTLDGASVCNTAGSGNDFVLFSRTVDQGPHTLNVLVEYQGDSTGFSYFKGYRYRVGDSRRFNIVSSASKGMTVTAYERGGPTTPFEERLAVSIR
jgi:hypothetical protein